MKNFGKNPLKVIVAGIFVVTFSFGLLINSNVSKAPVSNITLESLFTLAQADDGDIKLKKLGGYKKYYSCTPHGCPGNSMHCHYTGSATCWVEDQYPCPCS